MFTTRKDLQDQLEAAHADIERLEQELSTAQIRVEEASTKDARIAELEEQIKNEQEAHEVTFAELEEEKEKTSEEAIQALVAEEVAKSSHPPVELVNEPEGTLSSKPHLEKFEAIEDPAEATRYFKEHEKAIRAEMLR